MINVSQLTVEIVKTATLRLDIARTENVEFATAVIQKLMNVNQRIVENVEFVRKMCVLTAANFVLFVQNVRMRNVNAQLNAVPRSLVVPARIAKMELVWTETVELAVLVIL